MTPITSQRLSDNALKLILEFEVGGGQTEYERQHLNRTDWPGGDSGVTVGIGYDLGYHPASEIRENWTAAGLSDSDALRLASAAGKTRGDARAKMLDLRDINIPWETAWWVFNERTLPKFIRQTLRAFPGADLKLTADAFGALVSLVFNRGRGMDGPRRMEMRSIRDLIAGDYAQADLQRRIAVQIRTMVHLWEGTDIEAGMRRRRNAEADLVEGKS